MNRVYFIQLRSRILGQKWHYIFVVVLCVCLHVSNDKITHKYKIEYEIHHKIKTQIKCTLTI